MSGKVKKIEAVKGKHLSGKVVTISNAQTAVVEVFRVWRHPIYKKAMRRSQKHAVHVSGEMPVIGDMVTIAPCIPVSKNKHYLLIENIKN